MFGHLGAWLTSFLSGYVASVVATLATGLTPVALAWLTVYIANYGYAVLRGEAQDPFSTFAWKMVKMSFILGIALSAASYMNLVFSTADGLQDSMATIFLRSGYADSAPTTVFSALDTANDTANALLKDMWKDAGILRLDLVVASIFFSLGTVVFLVLGAFVAILSKVVLAFAMAIGPIAILTLMFKPTAKFFDAWLSTSMSAVVLAWFVFFALGLSFYVVDKLLGATGGSGAFTSAGTVSAIEAAATYLVIMVLLAILLYQAPHLASALTGGASIRTGATVAAGYVLSKMVNRNRGGGGGKDGGGGSVDSGAGPAHYAGRAFAATGHAALAAYQRVARRGNRS